MFHRIAQNQGHEIFDLLTAHRNIEELEHIKQALNDSTYAESHIGDSVPLFFALTDCKMVKKFLEFGADSNRLNLAKILAGNLQDKNIFSLLLESGIDVNSNYEGKTPLTIAIEKNRPDWIDLLKKMSPKLDSKI